jgi:hypothetical protein
MLLDEMQITILDRLDARSFLRDRTYVMSYDLSIYEFLPPRYQRLRQKVVGG